MVPSLYRSLEGYSQCTQANAEAPRAVRIAQGTSGNLEQVIDHNNPLYTEHCRHHVGSRAAFVSSTMSRVMEDFLTHETAMLGLSVYSWDGISQKVFYTNPFIPQSHFFPPHRVLALTVILPLSTALSSPP